MPGGLILVVDDDEDACDSLADVLSDFGYDADAAHDGREALEMAGRHLYRLALLDYRMPDMTGVELFEQLRRSGVAAVLITGHAGPDVRDEAAKAGMRAMLAKPLDVAELLPLVKEVVGDSG